MVELYREEQLHEEDRQIVTEIIENLNILLACDWDSDTVKSRLVKLIRDHNILEAEYQSLQKN